MAEEVHQRVGTVGWSTPTLFLASGANAGRNLKRSPKRQGIVPDFKFVGFRITSSLHLQLHLLSRKSAGDKVIITNKT